MVSQSNRMSAAIGLMVVGTCLAGEIPLPSGWIKPINLAFNEEWRKESSSRFLSAGSDFNCDGLIDSAFILEPTKGLGIGLFVCLQESRLFKCRKLYDSRKDPANTENLSEDTKTQVQLRFRSIYGIKVVENGLARTACGKGYWECEKGEKSEVLIKCKGIDFFPFDQGGDVFYYWEPGRSSFMSAVVTD